MSNVIDLEAFRKGGGEPPSRDDYERLLRAFSTIQDTKRRRLVLDFAEVLAETDKRAGQE